MENSQTPVTKATALKTMSELAIVSKPINAMAESNMFPTNGNLISLNASSYIPFELAKNGGNYSSWKSQMSNLLFGYGLIGQGSYLGGYNNNIHGSDNNLYGEISQPNHMQTNRRRPPYG
ncbi:Hypothetical predicted protein [Olea europaea subsp. europaea]|uniref:Retrotransposon Copia-like N-terminal domain-containing protein n=1 Tax=Olea europaea subsp. europaea TaxID=158383 RepID=A0A8S0TF00_OLEEU|nr:Hypothetical predicted protein [Olea europaea subsp. europaea]